MLTITHAGGESITAEELFVRGTNIERPGGGDGWWQQYEEGADTEKSDTVSLGDSVSIGADEDYTVRVVWESSQGGGSETLYSEDGPDA